MKKAIFIFIIVWIFACGANAQTRKSAQTKAWKQFQTAVARGDKQAVAAMIEKFPFEASIIGEKLEFTVKSKADFIKNYTSIFTARRRKEIARGKYESLDGEEFNFSLFDDNGGGGGGLHVFRFRKIGATYKWVGSIAVG